LTLSHDDTVISRSERRKEKRENETLALQRSEEYLSIRKEHELQLEVDLNKSLKEGSDWEWEYEKPEDDNISDVLDLEEPPLLTNPNDLQREERKDFYTESRENI
jgi:hypothetical protein